MSLSEYVVPRIVVEIPESATTFSVRGLNFSDLEILLNEFDKGLDPLIAVFAQDANIDDMDEDFALKLITVAPDLVAKVIAVASDEPDAWEVCKRLDISTSMDALSKLFDLTTRSFGGPKKFLERVIGMFQTARASLPDTGP